MEKKCDECDGSGRVWDPNSHRDVIEGNKLRNKINCPKCHGTKTITVKRETKKVANIMKPWIQTYTGQIFDFYDYKKHEFNPEDFAHALSLLCRYNGHCHRFYSVAEHLIRCSYLAPEGFEFEALMHDVSEAYLSDMPTPLKNIIPEYRIQERNIEQVIAKKFNLPWPLSEEVKLVDRRILLTEKELLMNKHPRDWAIEGEAYTQEEFFRGLDIVGPSWELIEQLFLKRFNQLKELHDAKFPADTE